MGLGPQRLGTPRTGVEDLFSQLLAGGGNVGQPPQTGIPQIDRMLQQQFGRLSAAQAGPLGQLASGNMPSFQGPFGIPLNELQTSILGGVGGGTDILNALRALGTGTSGGLPTAATTNLEALAGPAALEDVFKQIRSASEFGLGRDVADIREQFSASGLRDTTDLARAIGARQSESETGLQSLFGQLGLQNLGQRTSAAQALGGLGLGEAGQRLQALMGFPTVAGGLFGLGEAARGIEEAPLLRQIQEFQRTQGANLPALLQFISGTPQIVGPGAGSQLLSAGTQLGAAKLGGKQ